MNSIWWGESLQEIQNLKIVRKEERSPVRGHNLGKLSSPPLEKEDKNMLLKGHNSTLGQSPIRV